MRTNSSNLGDGRCNCPPVPSLHSTRNVHLFSLGSSWARSLMCKPRAPLCTAGFHGPEQTRPESTWENMGRVKSPFSASLWWAKASAIPQRSSKHFFKVYLDISHLGGGLGGFSLGPLPPRSLYHQYMDLRQGGCGPASPPEHQDIWLNLELWNPQFPSAGTPPTPYLPGHRVSQGAQGSGLQSHGCSGKWCPS